MFLHGVVPPPKLKHVVLRGRAERSLLHNSDNQFGSIWMPLKPNILTALGSKIPTLSSVVANISNEAQFTLLESPSIGIRVSEAIRSAAKTFRQCKHLLFIYWLKTDGMCE
ncbi:hypothetical protein K470DRAFT_255503 [Piedraia hortae CBS 480.64]|uniref:Uncharacterized protein n=1 Tax=Piedraia hortae CBS 480.64 TaxID=1314780 RepID=A0A6A7C5Y4_9PEZI|nr:hypothetical protein K470DRAFT_255503 [Piedraia hortae CBS 480.64]